MQKTAKETIIPHLFVPRDYDLVDSFHEHPSFGPAGGMHGATYTCDVEFSTDSLNTKTNWVIDIGKASAILAEVLTKYNFKNLDDVFPNGELTTTEPLQLDQKLIKRQNRVLVRLDLRERRQASRSYVLASSRFPHAAVALVHCV
jgi:6-pyruvoyl-tetrahydropterin synthase